MLEPNFAQLMAMPIVLPLLLVLLVMGAAVFVVRQYRRCPSNRAWWCSERSEATRRLVASTVAACS